MLFPSIEPLFSHSWARETRDSPTAVASSAPPALQKPLLTRIVRRIDQRQSIFSFCVGALEEIVIRMQYSTPSITRRVRTYVMGHYQ